jgi:L-ascorbate metabolism protein UlaG (beta-lactamase superfamily)
LSPSRRLALVLIGSLALGPAAGCKAIRLTGSNVALFFRAPDPPPASVSNVVTHDARIAATWIGHATVLVQLDDKFILTDPIFTEYAGHFTRRLVKPGLGIDRLPPLAAVLVSHRHVDHLSPRSLKAIGGRTPEVIVPPGAAGDVPRGPYVVRELWRWESWEEDGMRITAVPANHNGGRFFDRKKHPRAFTGYVVEYHGLTVYFAGDTAFDQEAFLAIAEHFPHVDLALMPIGPIQPSLTTRRNHLNPEDALEASRLVGAAAMLPIHHDTFVHSFDAPGDCLSALRSALAHDAPYPGERVRVLAVGERGTFGPGEARSDVARASAAPPPAAAGAQGAP